jgi:hypothetical protein
VRPACDADHAVARDPRGEVLVAEPVGPPRAARGHQIADIGGRVDRAQFDVVAHDQQRRACLAPGRCRDRGRPRRPRSRYAYCGRDARVAGLRLAGWQPVGSDLQNGVEPVVENLVAGLRRHGLVVVLGAFSRREERKMLLRAELAIDLL